MSALSRRGVAFIEQGASSFAGVEGKVDGYVINYGPVKTAAFTDSEGNVLALNEIVGS